MAKRPPYVPPTKAELTKLHGENGDAFAQLNAVITAVTMMYEHDSLHGDCKYDYHIGNLLQLAADFTDTHTCRNYNAIGELDSLGEVSDHA